MTGVTVTACGMSTAVGLTAPAACAALRARLDNFQETRFISQSGDWILGAEVPLSESWRGLPRMSELLIGPIRECLARANERSKEIPILLCFPESERVGRLAGLEEKLVAHLEATLDHSLQQSSRTYAFGGVGGAVAIRDARKMIQEGATEVIVAGVDSFLTAETLRVFDREDRLLTAANSNGFIASEAGAAVLLSSSGAGLKLRGIGLGNEEASIGSGEPTRAEGMVSAMRQGLDEAGLTYNDISYRIADLAGEQFYFREATLAQARLWRGERDPEDVWHPADGMGETGAAVVPICLGVGLAAAQKAYAPGPIALVHAAHDDGRRAAIVLEAAV